MDTARIPTQRLLRRHREPCVTAVSAEAYSCPAAKCLKGRDPSRPFGGLSSEFREWLFEVEECLNRRHIVKLERQ